jgi:hypothetical protein
MITQTRTDIRLKAPRRGAREAVEMQEKRFGYFPKRFRWRGRIYQVEAVERCWTSARRNFCLCFRVRCREGQFELFQDVRLGSWEVARV